MLKKLKSIWNKTDKKYKIATIVATSLLIYTLIGFLLIPYTVKQILETKLPETINRSVSIHKVNFNPFNLRLVIDGIKINKKEAKGNLFKADSIVINLDSFSLFRLTVVLDELKLFTPEIDLSFGRGTTSVSDLMGSDNDSTPSKEGIFPFIIRNFLYSNGTCILHDEVKNITHHVENINLNVPFTSTLEKHVDESIQPTLKMDINGTPFSLVGETRPFKNTRKTLFNFTINKANIADYWEYLPLSKTSKLNSGTIDSKLSLFFELDEKLFPRVIFNGDASINDLNIAHKSGDTYLKLKSLHIDINEMSIFRQIFKINKVSLNEPYLKAEIKKDGQLDLLSLIEQQNRTTNKDKSPKASLPTLEISKIVVENGELKFVDNKNKFNKDIKEIKLTATNLTTTQQNKGEISILIGTQESEEISLNAQLDLSPLKMTGKCKFSNFAIDNYSTYLKELPLRVKEGTLEINSEFSFDLKNEQKLFNLHAGVNKLKLTNFKKDKTLVSLNNFRLSNSTIDVLNKEIELNTINLDNFFLNITQDKNGIDLLDFKQSTKPSTKKVNSADNDNKNWNILISNFNSENSKIKFNDKNAPRKGEININPIKLNIKNLSYPEKTPAKINLTALINKKGEFKLNTNFSISKLKTDGNLSLTNLKLSSFNHYFPKNMQLKVAKGNLNLDTKFVLYLKDSPQLDYAGSFSLNDLLVRDSLQNDKFFHLKKLSLNKFEGTTNKIKISKILIDSAQTFLKREKDGTINISRMLTGKRAAPPLTDEEMEKREELAKKELAKVAESERKQIQQNLDLAPIKKENYVFINEIQLNNGSVYFNDQYVAPAFDIDITKMNSLVKNLTLPHGQKTNLIFNATIDEKSPLKANGFITPTDEGLDTDVTLSLSNLDMTQLSPYTEKYIAYPVQTGMLSSDILLKLRGKFISVENIFDIYQFNVGQKIDNPEAPSMPIEFGLALLKDSSGNIRLDIPVEGDLSDPQFKLGKVIAKAIVNLILKAITSPFALISALAGGGEDMNVIGFEAGKFIPQKGVEDKIKSIVTAMQKRPGLNIEVSGFTSQEDIPALEKLTFERMIKMPKYLDLESDGKAPKSIDDIELTPDEYEDYLEDVYSDAPFDKPTNFLGIVKTLPIPDMEKALKDHIKITDTELQKLSRERAEKIRAMLTYDNQIPPERVFLKNDKATGKATGPRVELGLK